ncbi:MnhB domain-containing protein [Acidaminobacter hydrogenoformans]|uniref:Multicomponent Na+:H+ antiporter subunit B n=1 Tax=Acidaminobacter hydrogenoformans DSM 2784 TaxID=1120920 RepID=A0A1G5RQB2_9FIRM|nr:MnhB domain-containing protein [Acidaminobacter hydrogenoformans]SCZ76293.1 multicomponent Na+:H+ antiporter subunit B [Acidaminobacter hydrogenoformans DSM 2784]
MSPDNLSKASNVQKHELLRVISLLLLPFMLMFGLYVVFNGDLSPGGGFQGGVILATAYILVYFISEQKTIELSRLIRIEKYLFLALITAGILQILFFSANFAPLVTPEAMRLKRIILIFLNTLIGAKVALGMSGIITMFFEEGSL